MKKIFSRNKPPYKSIFLPYNDKGQIDYVYISCLINSIALLILALKR